MPNEILGTGSVISTAELLRWNQNPEQLPMTESERFEAMGQAMGDLKAAKAHIAMLTDILGRHAEQLRQTGMLLSRLVWSGNCAGLEETMESIRRDLSSEGSYSMIPELARVTERARFLQEQIDNF